MARITPEQIEQINEVYAQCGVKTQTAKIVGVSVASVNKYLKKDYVPRAQQEPLEFDKDIAGAEHMLEVLQAAEDRFKTFFEMYELSPEEKEELKKENMV